MKMLRLAWWIFLGLIFTLSVFFWVRSYFRVDTLTRRKPSNNHDSFLVSQGTIRFLHYNTVFRMTSGERWEFQTKPADADALRLGLSSGTPRRWSIGILRGESGLAYISRIPIIIPDRYWCIDLPLWFPTALSATAMAAMFLRTRLRPRNAQQHAAKGYCFQCGYDLRAHVPGGAGDKCPECGTPISPQSASPTPVVTNS